MHFFEKVKCWFNKNKKYILLGSSVALIFIGSGVGYVLFKNSKISFADWIKIASKEELDVAYSKFLPIFHKTGVKPFEMQQIDNEIGLRSANEWFGKHPPNLDPHFRYTNANLFERD